MSRKTGRGESIQVKGANFAKSGDMEGEKEKAVQGRRVIGSLIGILTGGGETMEVESRLKDSIVFPTFACVAETWICNESQRS